MQNPLSSKNDPFADWAKNLTLMALNNDLSSREVESYTAKWSGRPVKMSYQSLSNTC